MLRFYIRFEVSGRDGHEYPPQTVAVRQREQQEQQRSRCRSQLLGCLFLRGPRLHGSQSDRLHPRRSYFAPLTITQMPNDQGRCA